MSYDNTCSRDNCISDVELPSFVKPTTFTKIPLFDLDPSKK